MLELLQQGQLVMAAILLASVVALAVFLERVLALRQSRVLPRRLVVQVRDLVAREQFPEALTLCKTEDGPLSRVFGAGIRNRGKPRPAIKEHLEEVGRQEAGALQRGVAVVGTVGSIAPLLGLLGTVWGMIDTFKAIQVHGVGDPEVLAGGISTALYTTLAGLMVAIPAVVAHRYLLSRVDSLLLMMEAEALDLLDLVTAAGPEA